MLYVMIGYDFCVFPFNAAHDSQNGPWRGVYTSKGNPGFYKGSGFGVGSGGTVGRCPLGPQGMRYVICIYIYIHMIYDVQYMMHGTIWY